LHRGQFGFGEVAQFGVVAFQDCAMVGDLVENPAILTNGADDFAELRTLLGDDGVFAIIRNYAGIAEPLVNTANFLIRKRKRRSACAGADRTSRTPRALFSTAGGRSSNAT
jgi:hypothetical protein